MTFIYRFWIPYLGIYINLGSNEIYTIEDYVFGRIGYTELYKRLYPYIKARVPRGYRRSVMMYIVRLYEIGEYEELEVEEEVEKEKIIREEVEEIPPIEEKKIPCLRLYLEWHVKTRYIKKHHNFITEGYASIELYVPKTYYELNRETMLNKLNEKLFSAYVYGLTREYFFVAEEEYYDFEKAYIIRVYDMKSEECIGGTLIDFEVGISRKEDAMIQRDADLSKRVSRYIEDAVNEFVDELREDIKRFYGGD